MGEKAARIPRAGRGAVGTTSTLAWEKSEDILELGPREVLLPKVKPRREASTSHRGVLLHSDLRSAAFGRTAATLSPTLPASYSRPHPGVTFAAIEMPQSWLVMSTKLASLLVATDIYPPVWPQISPIISDPHVPGWVWWSSRRRKPGSTACGGRLV